MEKYSDLLSSLPLFHGIETGRIETVLTRVGAYTHQYEKEEYIRHFGDPADFIGIILEGNVQVLNDDFYGNRNIIASFGKGALFAEAFACSGIKTLPVDILSCSKTTIMFLQRDRILNSCDHSCEFHHTLIGNLLGIVARKNMMLSRKLRYISHKTTGEKIMAYLNDQAKQHGSSSFTIPFDRQELSDYLGVERSAMSAEISKLVKQGIIETRRSYFKLLKPMA